jgi:hypothetical protein
LSNPLASQKHLLPDKWHIARGPIPWGPYFDVCGPRYRLPPSGAPFVKVLPAFRIRRWRA